MSVTSARVLSKARTEPHMTAGRQSPTVVPSETIHSRLSQLEKAAWILQVFTAGLNKWLSSASTE
jgi:hypothetical protein